MSRIRTIASTAAVALAAAFGPIAAANAAPEYEVTATKNGVVKAHAVYFTANNTLCVNLLNAPNPGAYAAVELYTPDGRLWATALWDLYDDGQRYCKAYDMAFNGQSMRMVVTFHPQQGAEVKNFTWIIM